MTNRRVRVSVIMIFYNAARFIHEAVESVFAQTYGHWELLLIDDGSRDSSTAIARRWAEDYPGRVRYLEHGGRANRGMSASRNLGIRHALGEYIAFLDADDVYLPQKLERQVAILDSRTDAAMVYNATQYWYSWTGKPEDVHRDRLRSLGVSADVVIEPPRLLKLFFRGNARTPAICSCLLRREAIERIGGFEETFRGIFEDRVFFFKLSLNVPVLVTDGCWDRYRQHPESHCQVMSQIGEWHRGSQPSPADEAFLNWFEQYLIANGNTDSELRAILKKKLRPYCHPILWRPINSLHCLGRMQRLWKRLTLKETTGRAGL